MYKGSFSVKVTLTASFRFNTITTKDKRSAAISSYCYLHFAAREHRVVTWACLNKEKCITLWCQCLTENYTRKKNVGCWRLDTDSARATPFTLSSTQQIATWTWKQKRWSNIWNTISQFVYFHKLHRRTDTEDYFSYQAPLLWKHLPVSLQEVKTL